MGAFGGARGLLTRKLKMSKYQVTAPSSERRTLIARLLGTIASRTDIGTQAHVLLTQLHRLAEDRIDQVGALIS
jgi:hypothetical protein